MNTKLSGAQLVLVKIERVGKNYLPLVEYLRDRFIKFIDFAPAAYLPNTTDAGLQSSVDMSFSITNAAGNEFIHYEMPLERFDYTRTLGVRQPIFNKINLRTSYINCNDVSQVGKVAALVFWYDLPQYSSKNDSKNLITDSIEIPLTTEVRYNQFPDLDRMKGKRFRRILLGQPSVTPDQNPGLPAARLQNVYMTLRKGSYNVVENLPLPLLYQLQMLEKSEFQNIIFDFQDSFLTIGGQGTIPNVKTDYVGKYVFCNVQYEA